MLLRARGSNKVSMLSVGTVGYNKCISYKNKLQSLKTLRMGRVVAVKGQICDIYKSIMTDGNMWKRIFFYSLCWKHDHFSQADTAVIMVRIETVAKETIKFSLIYRQKHYWCPKKTPSKTYLMSHPKNTTIYIISC